MDIRIKRAYETPADSDGQRILIDGLWPRGVSKQQAAIDVWLKELAPSAALRQWFGHDPDKWAQFRRRYRSQLQSRSRATALSQLRRMAIEGRVTLVYAARDREHNNAVVLEEYLRQHQ